MPRPPVAYGRTAPSVCVTDLDLALTFYCGVLGLTKTFENGDPVGFVILESGHAEVHLHLVPQHRATTTNVFHVMVDDVDALYEHVVAAGPRIIKGLRDQDYGLRAFVMADPDGNRIDVGQAL
jgi:predicted enzyme related to lactoylglutathione lyase